MKITKFPDSIDADKILYEEIKKRNSVCPFCNESRQFNYSSGKVTGISFGMTCTTWYGKKSGREHPILSLFKFWERNHYWKILYGACHTCGCGWATDPFPTDIMNEISL